MLLLCQILQKSCSVLLFLFDFNITKTIGFFYYGVLDCFFVVVIEIKLIYSKKTNQIKSSGILIFESLFVFQYLSAEENYLI